MIVIEVIYAFGLVPGDILTLDGEPIATVVELTLVGDHIQVVTSNDHSPIFAPFDHVEVQRWRR